jgi:alkylated DNA repair dioxygenase AlkB
MKDTRNPPSLRSHPSSLSIIPDFLPLLKACELFETLLNQTPWREETLRIFGRWVTVRRRVAFYASKPIQYGYSGIIHHAAPIPIELTPTLESVRTLSGEPYNSILLNLYPDGDASLGWHRDNERELGSIEQIKIASLSLGATRRFGIREINSKREQTFDLKSGTLLLMDRGFQTHYQHRVLKDATIRAPRINLSFRTICFTDLP